jgi:integrase
MPKIKDERYKEFLEKGSINLFSMDELDKGLKVAGQSKFGRMARAFLITLYYTGARPVEILQLKPTNFEKKKTYLTIQIPTAKRGVPRVVSIPFARKYAKELWQYTESLFEDIYVFYDLISRRNRVYKPKQEQSNKYGKSYIYHEGEKEAKKDTVNVVITDRVYYYVKKWTGVNPYFLRHSRMSALSQNGADMNELRQFKGAKSFDSVYPYLHMSSQVSQKIGRKLK